MIEHISVVIPIRRRTYSLATCVQTLAAHARFRNEVILVMDRPEDGVRDWVKKYGDWLEEHGFKVLESPFTTIKIKDQFGTANASNYGWNHAKYEWLMCMDDDMVPSPNWDYNLLRHVTDLDGVYVPINVRPETAVNKIAGWGDWYHLTYPKRLIYTCNMGSDYYVKESDWLKWFEETKRSGVYREPCAVRKLGHWMPILINRRTFEKSGGYDPGVGRDINFDTKLGDMGYVKTVVRDSFFLHMKGFMQLDVTAPSLPLGSDEVI